MNDPMAPLDNIKSRILTEELDMKNYSEDLVREIKNHLPKRIDNSMYIWKKTALEKKAGFMLISDDNEDNANDEKNARQENLKILERINKRPQSAVTLNEISGDFARDFEDPCDVTFKFLAGTGKRSKDGVLVTHNGNFKFHKSKESKSGDRIRISALTKSEVGARRQPSWRPKL